MNNNRQELKKANHKNVGWIRRIVNKISLRIVLGILAGAIVGVLYWELIGCNGGSCPITSSPTKTIALFGLMGGWISFRK